MPGPLYSMPGLLKCGTEGRKENEEEMEGAGKKKGRKGSISKYTGRIWELTLPR